MTTLDPPRPRLEGYPVSELTMSYSVGLWQIEVELVRDLYIHRESKVQEVDLNQFQIDHLWSEQPLTLTFPILGSKLEVVIEGRGVLSSKEGEIRAIQMTLKGGE